MGEKILLNNDGTVSQIPPIKTINNVNWIDHKQYKNKYSFLQCLALVAFVFPIYGWLTAVISFSLLRGLNGYWPFFGIKAIEHTKEPIKLYCDKKGKLGLYANKQRITNAVYHSIQQLNTVDYPAFILESEGKFSVYNYVQRKILFKDSDNIVYLGDNTVLVEKESKQTKYSLIGMQLS